MGDDIDGVFRDLCESGLAKEIEITFINAMDYAQLVIIMPDLAVEMLDSYVHVPWLKGRYRKNGIDVWYVGK